jgi:hypothetical protein
MTRTRLPAAVLIAAAVVSGGIASADNMSRAVISAFKGELVISKNDLPEGKNDKDTIAKIKSERLKELTGEAKDDVVYWRFHYTAFLNRTGATQLKMEFYTGNKFVADNRLDSIDPKSTVLTGDISINEDEGLSKGKAYVIKLVTDKDVVVASTPLVMK